MPIAASIKKTPAATLKIEDDLISPPKLPDNVSTKLFYLENPRDSYNCFVNVVFQAIYRLNSFKYVLIQIAQDRMASKGIPASFHSVVKEIF